MQRSDAEGDDAPLAGEDLDHDMDKDEKEEEEEGGDLDESAASDGDPATRRPKRRKYAVWLAYVGAGYHVSNLLRAKNAAGQPPPVGGLAQRERGRPHPSPCTLLPPPCCCAHPRASSETPGSPP